MNYTPLYHPEVGQFRGGYDVAKYGFYDAVNVETGELAKAYLALDQGMIMVSISNFVKDGVIRDYFHSDPIGQKPKELLEKEVFSIQQKIRNRFSRPT
ncbi:glucoamylase family protein [uncultured Paenibacillus sp.]|uniref:glucoamylase family protein n=1 Tax=uncultured Paenibacillus sp. TaxID=227322 RepID=UPI002804438C|nr:glucoamylase family protein [uncultured Paenibacillus sp.]